MLTLVLNQKELSKLLKVRGFFVNVGKAKLKSLEDISNSDFKRSSCMKASRTTKKPVETLCTIVLLHDVNELERSYMDIANP